MYLSRKTAYFWRASMILVLCLVLAFLGGRKMEVAASSLLPASQSHTGHFLSSLNTLYMPLIIKPGLVVQGHVNLNGVAAPGINLELYRNNGSSRIPVKSTITAADGSYQFEVPQMSPGESYYVTYSSQGSSALHEWMTMALANYTSGLTGNSGDFDIGNIDGITPAPAAVVSLPLTFQWTLRPATPDDNYQVFMESMYSECNVRSPWLGYTDTYTITTMPEFCLGLTSNYYWSINVSGGHGGYGRSYYTYSLKFNP